jgi:hypothetical protein
VHAFPYVRAYVKPGSNVIERLIIPTIPTIDIPTEHRIQQGQIPVYPAAMSPVTLPTPPRQTAPLGNVPTPICKTPSHCSLPEPPPSADISNMDSKNAWTVLLGLLQRICHTPGEHLTVCMSATQYLFHKKLLSTSIIVPVTSMFAKPHSIQFKLAKPEKLLPVGSLAYIKLLPITQPQPLDDFMYICRIKVGTHVLTAMIDTGASFTVIDYDTAITSDFYIHNTSPVAQLETANKTAVSVEGTIKQNISIGNYTAYTQTILLMKGLTTGVDIIIGQDFLLKNRVWVGEGQMIIKHRKGDHKFPSSFFTTNSPTAATIHRPITVSTLVKHMKKHGQLCLAWTTVSSVALP